jgi:hypothetical protein
MAVFWSSFPETSSAYKAFCFHLNQTFTWTKISSSINSLIICLHLVSKKECIYPSLHCFLTVLAKSHYSTSLCFGLPSSPFYVLCAAALLTSCPLADSGIQLVGDTSWRSESRRRVEVFISWVSPCLIALVCLGLSTKNFSSVGATLSL